MTGHRAGHPPCFVDKTGKAHMNRIYQGKVTAVEIPDGKEEHNQMAAKRL
ncbi:MAG: hypothetical protein ABSC18_08855 [Verrucomicrobiota bacterium]